MEFSDLIRKEAVIPWTMYSGDLSNIDVTPGTDIAFKCPATSVLRRMQASMATLTAASQFVVELVRNSAGTPVVLVTLTSAVPYVAGVVVDSGEIDVPLFKDEPLVLRFRATDADTDDGGGVLVLGTLQFLQDTDGR